MPVRLAIPFRILEAAHACYGKVQQLKASEKAAAGQKPAKQPSA